MRIKHLLARAFAVLSLWACDSNKASKVGTGTEKSPFHKEIEVLMAKMSLEEKVGQMTQLNLDVVSVGSIYNLEEPHKLDSSKLYHAIVERHVGSILNVGGHAYSLEHWKNIISEIQNLAVSKGKNGVPIIYGIDAIHGANYLIEGTLMPQPLAQAASFNAELVEKLASVTAYETRASGIPWNFSPVLDLGRQPLWSRMFETYGEDVHLAKALGEACIKGYQGDNPSHPEKVAATMKHFLGYSLPFTGRDRTPVYIHPRQLREYFLPTFEAAVRQGALTVMINSGELNGIPCHADYDILTVLLRNELGFKGLAVTDWEDIEKLVLVHRVAANMREAVKLSINAGIDMAMVPNDYRFTDALIDLANSGEVSMERINEAVYRILHVKYSLGLFDAPFTPSSHQYPLVQSDSFARLNLEAARQSFILLKNNKQTLPLKADRLVQVAGQSLNDVRYWNGAWSRTWQGTHAHWDTLNAGITLEKAMREAFPNARFFPQPEIPQNSPSVPLVVVLSEWPSTEKPGDIDHLNLSSADLSWVKQISASYQGPRILLLVQNRPRIIAELEPLFDAIILTNQPGSQGTKAFSQLLSGQFSPSGKLPYTYPSQTNALLTYDHKFTERLDVDFSMNAFKPQYEFGHGLSYAHFEYGQMVLSDTLMDAEKGINLELTIQNTGSIEARESVLLFVSDSVASITPPAKRLRGIENIKLKAGESRKLRFELKPEDLCFIDAELKCTTEPGWFRVRVGNQTALFRLP